MEDINRIIMVLFEKKRTYSWPNDEPEELHLFEDDYN